MELIGTAHAGCPRCSGGCSCGCHGDCPSPGRAGRPGAGRRHRAGLVQQSLLALLSERPMHGYEMICELSARTGGAWAPSPGSIYPTLQSLESDGLIAAEAPAESGRRTYSLTADGRARAAQSPATPWSDTVADPADVQVRLALAGLADHVANVLDADSADGKRVATLILQQALALLQAVEPTPGG